MPHYLFDPLPAKDSPLTVGLGDLLESPDVDSDSISVHGDRQIDGRPLKLIDELEPLGADPLP